MKNIEIAKLQEQVLSAKDEPLRVEQDGRVVGFFYPVKTTPRQQTNELWERLDAVLDADRFRKVPQLTKEELLASLRKFRDSIRVSGEALSATVIKARREERY